MTLLRQVRSLLLILSFLLPATVLHAQSGIVEYGDGHPPAMLRAIEQARASLPALMDKIMDPQGRLSSSVTLKVAFETPKGFENIWVDHIRKRRDTFTANLVNEPRDMIGKSIGDKVKFTQDQIIDWSLPASNGRNFGHFTTRVILNKLSADRAASIGNILTKNPLPKGF